MDQSEIINSLLKLLSGIGTFIFACEVLSENLQAVSSDKMKGLFSRISDNKIACVMVGALTTAAIQSSSATTVMVIGFVSAGLITLKQAACIIFGSEIGTTLTAQMVSLGMFSQGSISTATIFASLAGVGAILNIFAKKESTKKVGGILIGFGLVFSGLTLMSSSMEGFAQMDSLKSFLASIKSTIAMIVVGALVTALVQSSSAITSLAITMIVSGLINIEQGIYITLGANVGTCITGWMAAVKSGTNARRASLIQLIFNIAGVVLLAVFDMIIKTFSGGSVSVGIFFANMFKGLPQTQLSMFHTIFNIGSVIIALPLTQALVSFVEKSIPDDEKEKRKNKLYYFDENMLSTPTIAVAQIKKELVNMADIAINNFNTSIREVTTQDFSESESFEEREQQLEYLNRNLSLAVSRLSRKVLSVKDHEFLSSSYGVINDLDRVSSYSGKIVRYARVLQTEKKSFSPEAVHEINVVANTINDLYKHVVKVYDTPDRLELEKARVDRDIVADLARQMFSNNIDRMDSGKCDNVAGSQFLQLSGDLDKVAEHLFNINNNIR
ncbi:MAG: Na/Pi cotransporter family protein [Erysipelotrichaceae bacterium]|nr:Na/Pi cotransporter family protein [Erysipelotrichaceae bacterium]